MGAIEWTEYIFKHFEHTLISVGIYGAVDYLALVHYAGMPAKRFSLAQAKSIFRNGQSVTFHASAFLEQSPKGQDLVDMKLSDEGFNFLLSISTPYLSQSVQRIHQIVVNDKAILKEHSFIIDCLHPNPQSIGGPVRISKMFVSRLYSLYRVMLDDGIT
ncbi:hypothetical protein Cgig2_007198 [Carnegiea gigantea]|uniref:Uncharacterized protein n=1 Tax=Carnegiea gigantea TaxID=171969 RepID=A0A9Q1JIC5_9CARY|nr:hypothetical protein Cgig2_007198 [Carnegiea gigantea]